MTTRTADEVLSQMEDFFVARGEQKAFEKTLSLLTQETWNDLLSMTPDRFDKTCALYLIIAVREAGLISFDEIHPARRLCCGPVWTSKEWVYGVPVEGGWPVVEFCGWDYLHWFGFDFPRPAHPNDRPPSDRLAQRPRGEAELIFAT